MRIPDQTETSLPISPYRDFITEGLLVIKIKIVNQTKYKTIKNIIPDTWIYIQDREVRIGRFANI
jgi:hypothetical protein